MTAYVFHAYSDSNCTTAIARAAFISNPHAPTNVRHSWTGTQCTITTCTLNVSWVRNSSASGAIGYQVWTKGNVPNHTYQSWQTQAPLTNVNLGITSSANFVHYARVRAYKSVGGATVYSDWTYSQDNP